MSKLPRSPRKKGRQESWRIEHFESDTSPKIKTSLVETDESLLLATLKSRNPDADFKANALQTTEGESSVLVNANFRDGSSQRAIMTNEIRLIRVL